MLLLLLLLLLLALVEWVNHHHHHEDDTFVFVAVVILMIMMLVGCLSGYWSSTWTWPSSQHDSHDVIPQRLVILWMVECLLMLLLLMMLVVAVFGVVMSSLSWLSSFWNWYVPSIVALFHLYYYYHHHHDDDDDAHSYHPFVYHDSYWMVIS